MRKLRWSVGAAAVLFAAVGLGRAADDEAYDLRGPAPQVKQVFVSKGTLKIKDADMTMKVAGTTKSGKITMTATSEEEAKVLAVEGRNVTKCQTKIVKEKAVFTGTIDGIDIPEINEPTALEKETIISERVGEGKWKHVLVDTRASAKQKKELDNRNGIENDDDLYPKEKVKVGHKWTVDASALSKMLGNSFSDLKGKLNQHFTKVEEVDGEKCAVVESTGKISAKMKDEGEPTMDVEMELKVVTWKSLATGAAVKEKYEGKMKLSGTQKMDDLAVEMTMSGPISGESTTRLKQQK